MGFTKLKAKAFTPFHPIGYEHMREYAIVHPNGTFVGALMKNKKTGIYVLYNSGTVKSVPQDWAEKNCDPAIKMARIRAGISRAEMSRMFEIPIRTLENWDSGQRLPAPWAEKLIIEKLESLKNN